MDKPLSQEAQSRIGELCESIARRDLLDVDAQEELRGHIEDKVIAYLEGREALTELDAVVLAREHFGSPDTLKSYFHLLEPHRLNIGVVHKLSQLVFVSYSIQIVAVLLLRSYLYGNPLALFGINSKPHTLTPELMVATSGIIVVSVVCVLSAIQKMNLLKKFDQLSTRTLLVSAMFAFIVCACLPTWWRMGHAPLTNTLVVIFCVHIGFAIISCYTWLWWVDRGRGSLAHVAAASCAWLAMIMLHPIVARAFRAGGSIAFGKAYMDSYAGPYNSIAIYPFTYFQFGLHGSSVTILYMLFVCVVYGALVRRGRAARGDIAIAD